MEAATQLGQILLKSIAYMNGKWVGEFELIIHHGTRDVIGLVPFTYDRTWHLHVFKYPKGLDEHAREGVKQAFTEQFKAISLSIEAQLFQPREQYGAKPCIASFQIDERLSDKESIYVLLTLHDLRETFFMTIQLLNNVWHYKLHTKHESIETYKTFYAWEDAIFEQVIDRINQDKQYRLKFALHPKQFKCK